MIKKRGKKDVEHAEAVRARLQELQVHDVEGEDDLVAEPGLVVEDDIEVDLGEEEPVAAEEEPGEAEPGEPEAEPGDAEDEPEEAEEADEPEDELESEEPEEADEPEDDDEESDEEEEEAEPDDSGGSRRGRRIMLGVVGTVATLYVAGYFLTGTRMPANASIAGVDVSGMSSADARQAVDKALTPHVADQIVLTRGQTSFHINPADAGLRLNLDRSVEKAGGRRSFNPAKMVGLFFGTHHTSPAVDVDNAKIQGVISTVSKSVNRDVVEAQITFPNGKPRARQPQPGLVVSRADAATAIRGAYLVTDKPVIVPTVPVEPAVDAAGLAAEMKSFAEPAVSGPVTLAVGDKEVPLPVSAYSSALMVRVTNGALRPHIDAKALARPLTNSVTGIGKKAVDASVKIENNRPVVVPGKAGIGLQPEEMAIKLLPVLAKTGEGRKVSITAKIVDPRLTTADVEAMKIKEKISSFVTEFPYAEYRNINQGRAAEIINGTILGPGETFSFNRTVGERTVANGFTIGTVINGGVFREELGGGVSQVATTTYNAGFFGGMDDVEHHPHAFYISRYPVGREATVYFGSLDLRFKNPTKFGVLIRAYVVKSTPYSAGQMHVELWSTKVWDVKAGLSAKRNFREPGKQYDDTDKCVPQDPIRGFDIDVYRTFYRGGTRVKGETDTAHYQAADHVICGKKPSPN